MAITKTKGTWNKSIRKYSTFLSCRLNNWYCVFIAQNSLQLADRHRRAIHVLIETDVALQKYLVEKKNEYKRIIAFHCLKTSVD